MRYAVAIAAVWKLLDHARWMRHAVAVCTLFYGRVFIWVTRRTGKIVVFGRICLKQGYSFAMTTPAVTRWNVIRVSHDKGHVYRMARLTGRKVHVCRVFFMALHAVFQGWNPGKRTVLTKIVATFTAITDFLLMENMVEFNRLVFLGVQQFWKDAPAHNEACCETDDKK